MRQLYTFHTSRIYFAFILVVGAILSSFSARAQCWENFSVYQAYPYGQLCSPQYATLRAEYYNWNNDYINGEFRWYTSDTDPNPVHTAYVASDFGQLTSDYSLYADNGTTMWVSFYNYNTGCESYRYSYSFYISPSAYLYQDYAVKCRDDIAKVQLSSNVSGVTYQLFKLYEYYDPWYGWVQDYQYQGGNSTGYFEIYDFDPAQDQYKYFAKVYQPYGCSTPYYYPLYFEIIGSSPPSITGNLSVNAGSSTTLIANGQASTFNWYDASNNLVNQGYSFSTPTSLTPGTYTYQVQGVSFNGSCLSDMASVTITVNLPLVTYTSLFHSSNFIKTFDLSKPVGTVAGMAGTTPAGGVTYSIPIYSPPGTNGVQPSISVVYNSQSGNGNVGFGWNISGLSAIGRAGRDMYHDNVVSPVSNTSGDPFVLDGMRLTPITGLNGANGTIYAGEMETFSQIISYTNSSSNNPDWFKVIAKDGSIMEFGHTPDSRFMTDDGQNVIMWRLNKIIDLSGNYIEFVYDNAYRDSRITAINYTGNANTGLLPYNTISFTYKSRSDENIGYDVGASVAQKTLLDNITLKAENNTVKEYQFNYGFDNLHSLLKEVVETGSDGTQLNSTIFLYGEKPDDISVTQTTALTESELEFYSGDFDADGKTDLLAAKWYYSGTNPIRYHSKYELLSEFSAGSATSLYLQYMPSNSTVKSDPNRIKNFLTADYNKDGKDDILIIKTLMYNSTAAFDKININYTGSYNSSTGTTTNFTTSLDFSYPVANNQSYSWIHQKGNYFVPGDFDGDGNQDYVLILGNGQYKMNGYEQFKAFFTSPTAGAVNWQINNFGVGANSDPQFYAATVAKADLLNTFDFNGDGTTEILVTKDYQSYVLSIRKAVVGFGYEASVLCSTGQITKDSRIWGGDFNGDRKGDWLVRNANGSWNILYSTGQSFTTSTFSFNQGVIINGGTSDHKIIVSDFNGDGKSDILHGFPNSTNTSKLSVYFSRGTSSLFNYEQYDYANKLGLMVVGDFNGDGRSDFLNRNYWGDPADFVSIKSSGKERLLSRVTDGHNITTAFEYKNLTDKETFPYVYDRTVSLDDPANSNPYNYVQMPMYAVSSIITPNGVGGTNETTFRYEDAIVHRQARGFLGFKKTIAKNLTADITTVNENELDTQFAVLYGKKQTTSLTSASQLLAESQTTTSFDYFSSGYPDKRFFQKLDKVLSIDHFSGTASETVNSYDSYGNVTTSVSKVGTPSGSTVTPVETTTTTAAYSIHNTPNPSKPDYATVSRLRAGAAVQAATTQFTYNTNGLLASETAFSGLSKAVTTSYTYNGFGNATAITTSASGVTSRTSNATYDTKGRFAITKQAGVGTNIAQTGTSTYDARWGQPLTTTSSDCISTSFEYDGFGRLKKTNLPEGFSVNASLVWDVQGQNVFYSYTDYPGGKPDVKTWIDIAGRETKQQVAGFNNQWLTKLTTYNAKGNLATQTNPYYSNESPIITTNSYDVYNRLQSASNSLNTTMYTYNQLGGGNTQIITTDATGQTSIKTTDASGKVITSTDKGGNLDFTYDSRSNQIEVKHGSTVLITNGYDAYGRQTTITDKNAGTVTYDYDAFGQLKQQTDNSGQTYTMAYDDLGRMLTRQGPEGTTTNQYYNNNAGCSNNNLIKVIGFNGVEKEYSYDILQRLQTEKLTIDANNIYLTQYGYDTYGHLTSTTYPSGVIITNGYDNNGGLQTVSGGTPGSMTTLFTATAINGLGQYTGFTLGNGKTSTQTYTNGIPTRFYTQGVQDLNFNFDVARGNLVSRYDALKLKTETFGFDDLNRLTSTTVNSVLQQSLSYDGTTNFSMGNIMAKTDAGNYVYNNTKIHAVAYITNPPGSSQTQPVTNGIQRQDITYTPFLKTATISEAPYNLAYTYGPGYQRVKSELKFNGSVTETKYYVGAYEKQTDGSGTREIHYVSGGDGLCAMIVKEGGTSQFYFVYKDHLGSLLTLTDIGGNVIAEQNFDAWGRKRNYNTWDYTSAVLPVPSWLYRGFTGHEHLEQFALINMNGRMYDPIQGRMLSPDNYVSTPFGTQGYNRYSYAMNNPLSYVDPDGNFVWFVPIIAGALIGGTTSGLVALASGGNFWKGFTYGAVAGAISGGFSAIGTSLGTLGQSFAYNIMSNAASTIGTNLAFGNDITAGTILGSVAGGIIGGGVGNFTGVKGGWLANASAEVGFNSLKGAATGAIGGGIGAAIDRSDVRSGILNGAKYGVIGGAVSSGLMIAGFGPAMKPDNGVKSYINRINEFFGISNSYAPVFRRGGLYKTISEIFGGAGTARGVTWGRNLIVPNDDTETYIHEYMHFVQQIKTGFGVMQGKGIFEQTRAFLSFGGYVPYNVPGTNEFQADWWTDYFYRGNAAWYYNGGFRKY